MEGALLGGFDGGELAGRSPLRETPRESSGVWGFEEGMAAWRVAATEGDLLASLLAGREAATSASPLRLRPRESSAAGAGGLAAAAGLEAPATDGALLAGLLAGLAPRPLGSPLKLRPRESSSCDAAFAAWVFGAGAADLGGGASSSPPRSIEPSIDPSSSSSRPFINSRSSSSSIASGTEALCLCYGVHNSAVHDKSTGPFLSYLKTRNIYMSSVVTRVLLVCGAFVTAESKAKRIQLAMEGAILRNNA